MTELIAVWMPAIATALLHFVWQGALVGLLACLALSLLRNARPQARYAVTCFALGACAVLPVWNLLHAFAANAGAWQPIAMALSSGAPAAPAAQWDAVTSIDLPALPDAATAWIVALWALGAALLSLRMALGAWWIHDLRRHATPASGTWQACVDRLAPRFGISQSVAVRLVDAGDTPMATGFWRPMVLLPAAVVARMPTDLLEALLAHELAHISRHDYLVNLLQGAIETLLFYHPVVWWLSHRIRIERELVADDIAARVTGQPRQLAIALSELDRLAATRPAFAHAQHALAAHGGHLMSRIRQLVKPERRAIGTAALLPVLGIAAAGMAFYAQARFADDGIAVTAAPVVFATATVETSTDTNVAIGAAAATSVSTNERTSSVAINGGSPGYAVIRGDRDGFTMSGDTRDIDDIRAARRAIHGDFIWFQREGKTWVVQDAATLARVQAASRRGDEISAEMEVLSERMGPHSDRMAALGEQMEALHADMEGTDTADMTAASTRMEAHARKMDVLASRQMELVGPMIEARNDEARQREIEAKMADIDQEQKRVQRDMEREQEVMEALAQRMESRSAPMEALGRQMEDASRPMEQIGKDMEAVGDRLEREVKVADAAIRRIIDDAYARGLATPAPYMH